MDNTVTIQKDSTSSMSLESEEDQARTEQLKVPTEVSESRVARHSRNSIMIPMRENFPDTSDKDIIKMIGENMKEQD